MGDYSCAATSSAALCLKISESAQQAYNLVTFKLWLITYNCLHGSAPPHLTRFCTPFSAVAGRTHLRSADQHKLFVPRTSTSTFGPRAFHGRSAHRARCLGTLFSIAASWPRPRPAISINIFRQFFKIYLFNKYSDWLCFILHLHVLMCFVRFRHRTRFRDSFCLASVF